MATKTAGPAIVVETVCSAVETELVARGYDLDLPEKDAEQLTQRLLLDSALCPALTGCRGAASWAESRRRHRRRPGRRARHPRAECGTGRQKRHVEAHGVVAYASRFQVASVVSLPFPAVSTS